MAIENAALRVQLAVFRRQTYWFLRRRPLRNPNGFADSGPPASVRAAEICRLIERSRGSQSVVACTTDWSMANMLGIAANAPSPECCESAGWKTFLHNHLGQMVSIDFFTVPTIIGAHRLRARIRNRNEIGSIRRGCLNHFANLQRPASKPTLASYFVYYHSAAYALLAQDRALSTCRFPARNAKNRGSHNWIALQQYAVLFIWTVDMQPINRRRFLKTAGTLPR